MTVFRRHGRPSHAAFCRHGRASRDGNSLHGRASREAFRTSRRSLPVTAIWHTASSRAGVFRAYARLPARSISAPRRRLRGGVSASPRDARGGAFRPSRGRSRDGGFAHAREGLPWGLHAPWRNARRRRACCVSASLPRACASSFLRARAFARDASRLCRRPSRMRIRMRHGFIARAARQRLSRACQKGSRTACGCVFARGPYAPCGRA